MKHSNGRRPRSRGTGKRNMPIKGQNFESSGPDVKVRGTAQQVLEKYLTLARDASSSGDRVTAEGYLQHAEHYYRMLSLDQGANGANGRGRIRGPGGPDDEGQLDSEDGEDQDQDQDQDESSTEPETEAA